MPHEQLIHRRQAICLAGTIGTALVVAAPAAAVASPWPRLDQAIVTMTEAKKFLEDAPSGFGGHKRRAINALSTAIAEIEAAIAASESESL